MSILVLNSGSSSLKFGLFARGRQDEQTLLDGTAGGIGTPHGAITLNDSSGRELASTPAAMPTPVEALARLSDHLADHLQDQPIEAIAHRVVHGGPHLLDHTLITPAVLGTLRDSIHFAPLHIPPALALIEQAQRQYPALPQYACFDTTFHETMPEEAKHLPLPDVYWQQGIRRYGFHGLSYASIVHALGAGVPARLVIAHLGSGCSVCALRAGRSVDTSMGFTPTGGVVMATRTGDLDPGTILFLLRGGKSLDEVEALLNKQSGLQALSGHADIRDIEADLGDRHPEAALALEIFYASIAKTIAAYATVLGGIDLLVFTGGIGQHSERTRRAILNRLSCLTIGEFRSMPAEEELQIARETRKLMTA